MVRDGRSRIPIQIRSRGGAAEAAFRFPLAGHSDLVTNANAIISPYEDGPLIVRGQFRVVGPDGEEIDCGRRTVALCRCGRSARKPFCDGSHRAAGFSAPAGDARLGHRGGAPARKQPPGEPGVQPHAAPRAE